MAILSMGPLFAVVQYGATAAFGAVAGTRKLSTYGRAAENGAGVAAERSEIIFPGDANSLGNLFGGKLMQFIDLVGAVAAYRHARAILVVTASMDGLDFVATGACGRPVDPEG